MKIHNELSQVVITAVPRDLSHNPYIPQTARYKVTDCRSEREMVPWTTLTPSAAIEIIVPGPINKIEADRAKTEDKVVTVNTDQDLTTAHYEEYLYKIKNLKFVK